MATKLTLLTPLFSGGAHSMTSSFGPRVAPVVGASTQHNGIDLVGNSRSETILAFDSGTVTNVVNNCSGSTPTTGNTVTIDHGNGLVSVYHHMVKGSVKVSKGQYVTKGQPIGTEGSTGASTGNHLHFGLKLNGQWVDPIPYLTGSAVGVTIGGTPTYKPGKTAGAISEKLSQDITYKTVESELTKTTINTVNATNLDRTRSTGLLTYPTLVESPFIIVEIGGYTFGSYTEKGSLKTELHVDYPNYMTSIEITKINGTVNQYTLNMTYQIEAGEDPNLLDKIFSSVGYGKIYISYGDWAAPTFIYKREEAIITKVTSNVDFQSSKIKYVVNCTSNALALMATTQNFPARKAKPSTVILETLYNTSYGLLNVFYGMSSKTNVLAKGLIASDDKVVDIPAKNSTDPLSYINYLVTCMCANTNTSTTDPLKDSSYYLTIHDDIYNELGLAGPYFKVTKVESATTTISTPDTYEVDIGYPDDNLVTNFTLKDDNSWALFYKYAGAVSTQNYIYKIDDEGNILTEYSPNITTARQVNRTTEAQRSWWTQMTKFQVNAEMTVKGLVRPAVLMSMVRVNSFFYGQRHISSGLYVITKQVDRIDNRGYRTTLSLMRIAGDQDYITSTKQKITSTVPVANTEV